MKLWKKRQDKQQKTAGIRPWGGVKNTAIAALLVVNLVLLAALGCAKGYDAWIRHKTHQQIDSMLAKQGILCGSSVYRTMEHVPQAYTLRADENAEKQLAFALLSGDIQTEAKGNTAVWSGDNGTVSWSQSGKLDASVQLSDVEAPQDTDQAVKVVFELLQKAGFSVPKKQIAATQDNTGFAVSVQQEIEGTELIGCSLDISIAPDNIFTITGTWCDGTAQPLEIRALETYSEQQALFQFLAAKSGAGQILNVQAAYVLSDRSGGRFATIPCWRFSTDQGDYILNILTGKVVTAESIGETSQSGDGNAAGSGSAPDAGSGTSAAWTQPDTGTDSEQPVSDETDADTENQTDSGTSDPASQQNETNTVDTVWNAEG